MIKKILDAAESREDARASAALYEMTGTKRVSESASVPALSKLRRLNSVHEADEPRLGDVMIPNLLDHGILAPLFHDPLGFILAVNHHRTEQ